MRPFAPSRTRISARLCVPNLKDKLTLLFQKARNPRIITVSALDRELGMQADRSIRQYYRPDRPSGIPAELIDAFLATFRLTKAELELPLPKFQQLLDSELSSFSHEGWYGAPPNLPKLKAPPGCQTNIRFIWEQPEIIIDFIAESSDAPILALDPAIILLNLRRRSAEIPSVRVQTEFRIELVLRHSLCVRLLGLIEGSQLSCFQKPYLLRSGLTKLRIPADDEPFYFDETGRHTLWLLILGDVSLTAAEIKALDSKNPAKRRATADRIHTTAQAHSTVNVLRADFDVVA